MLNVVPVDHELFYKVFHPYPELYHQLYLSLKNDSVSSNAALSYFDKEGRLLGLRFQKIKDGRVDFDLSEMNQKKIVKVSPTSGETLYLADDIDKIIQSVKFPSFDTDLSSDEASEYLNELNIRKRISDDFSKRIENQDIDSVSRFKLPADYSVSLDDYFPFPDIKSVVKETLPWVKVKGKDKPLIVLLTNSYNQKVGRTPSMTFYNYQTLCIVDNIVVFDQSKILDLNPSLISHIDVYLNKIVIDNHFFNGIVSFHSKPRN